MPNASGSFFYEFPYVLYKSDEQHKAKLYLVRLFYNTRGKNIYT